MIRAIIVDDEVKGRDTLKNLLHKFCPEVFLVGLAGSVDEGLEVIRRSHPDLIFLDIEMPEEDGFSLIERAAIYNLEVIFTTAFPQYAIRAFKYSVLDYLLKPINIESLMAAVSKAQKVIQDKNTKMPKNHIEKLALPTLEGYEMVEIHDIIRCEADVNYTTFYFKSRDKILVARPLKEVEKALEPYNFFRLHKHNLVNLRHVSRYVKGKGGLAILSDGTSIDVSWRNKNELIERLGKLA